MMVVVDEGAGADPALAALGRCAALWRPASGASAMLLHDGGAGEALHGALARLTLEAAPGPGPGPEAGRGAGAPRPTPRLLPGGSAAPLRAVSRAPDGGLIALAGEQAASAPRLAPAFEALARQVRRRLRVPAGGSLLEAAFEAAALAMAVVGADRRLHALNRAGRRLLGEERVLGVFGSRLRALDACADRRLGEALGAAPGPTTVLTLPGAAGEAGLRCEVARIDLPLLPQEGSGRAEGARFLLTASPTAPRPPIEALLTRAYGLTPAEARLAGQLVAGRDLRGAAERIGVSHHTARKYLQIAFAKMGVRRQADLVRRALQLAYERVAPEG